MRQIFVVVVVVVAVVRKVIGEKVRTTVVLEYFHSFNHPFIHSYCL